MKRRPRKPVAAGMSTAVESEDVYSPDMSDSELKKLLNEIGHKISEAIKSRPEAVSPPEKSDRLTSGQKILGIVVSLIVIVGGLWGGLHYVVTSAITSAMVQQGKDLATITEQGKGLRKDVDRLLDQSAKDTLRSSLTENPLTKKAASQIKDAADWALRRKLEIDPNTILKVSEPLLKNPTPDNWEAATALLNLRSWQNSTLEQAHRHITQVIKGGEGAKVNFIPPGEWAEIDGGTTTLDGVKGDPTALYDMQLNVLTSLGNTVFKGSHIIYHGGKISLINVFFDGCTFDITASPRGADFVMHALGISPDTSFSAS